MTPNEGHLIQLAKQIGAIGLQAANAYNEAQARLNLELVITLARLETTDGTNDSLATLAKLTELNIAHKDAYATFMTAAVGQLATASAELPGSLADEYRDGIVNSVNWNLAAQAKFYTLREEWIEKAVAICHLVESRRSSISFGASTITFNDDADLASFQALVARVDEIHELEVCQAAERMARLSKSIATLGSHSV